MENKCYKSSASFEINQMEDGYVIYQYDSDKVHYLNHTASLVLELCNGKNSVEQIAKGVEVMFDLSHSAQQEVTECLELLLKEELIE